MAIIKPLALAAAVTLMSVGHASTQGKAQDGELKQLNNCHPPSSAIPGETSGSASRQGPWDSQSVDKSAILPSVGGETTSAAPTVQRHGLSVEARSDCPPETSGSKARAPN